MKDGGLARLVRDVLEYAVLERGQRIAGWLNYVPCYPTFKRRAVAYMRL